ncbi:MAG: glucuronate isomerase [Bacilli bacterium]|nr:glucuronate isomerase [Bacilli bacterium]
MKEFFDNEVLLSSKTAVALYDEVKDLPIIDYHCHLNQYMIRDDATFSDIGELWLAGDHYKWRVMRLCGVDEYYITGNASYEEKFYKFCEILPKAIGNAVYYWAHFELKQVFGINLEINKENAKEIYRLANEKIKDLSVQKLLKAFNVEFVATTDDPVDDLLAHGHYGNTEVTPTFRPDKVYALSDEYLGQLSKVVGYPIDSLDALEKALAERLDYFKAHGAHITDHGFDQFPKKLISKSEASILFNKRHEWTVEDKDAMFGYILLYLMKEYKKRDIVVQLHFAVTRNINTPMYKAVGVDHGFDVMSKEVDIQDVMKFLDALTDEERPTCILYTLNPNTIAPLACISGAFRNVYIGAAWWFNDTLEGIRNNLQQVSEYAVLGTNLGMLTDSRAFSSYSRFDFFRRILCDFVANKVEKGEYSLESAKGLVKDISYNNIKNLLRL